jgi:hypothetical protein
MIAEVSVDRAVLHGDGSVLAIISRHPQPGHDAAGGKRYPLATEPGASAQADEPQPNVYVDGSAFGRHHTEDR